MGSSTILVIHWELGPESKHAGARFWGAHSLEVDGRVADWPKEGLIAIGASAVTVVDGEGLELLTPVANRTEGLRGAKPNSLSEPSS